MSAFTKVLVIFVLLLSVAFAASQVILYGKREDFALKYNEARDRLVAATATLQKTQDELKDLRAQYDATKSRLESDIARLQADLQKEQAETARLKNDLAQETLSVKRLTEITNSLTQDLKARDATISTLKDTIADRDKTIRENLAKIDELTKSNADKDLTIGKLENELLDVKKQRKELADSEAYLSAVLAELRARGIAIPTQIQIPPIDARVTSVDPELPFAVIDKGAQNAVKPGTEFVLYDPIGGSYVATLIIHEVSDNVSVGQIVDKVKDRQVKVGDRATTRIR